MSKNTTHYPTLHGRARGLVEEMAGDNGCHFRVTDKQAFELNALCNTDVIRRAKITDLKELASGEHSSAVAISKRSPEAKRIHQLLNKIFNQVED